MKFTTVKEHETTIQIDKNDHVHVHKQAAANKGQDWITRPMLFQFNNPIYIIIIS